MFSVQTVLLIRRRNAGCTPGVDNINFMDGCPLRSWHFLKILSRRSNRFWCKKSDIDLFSSDDLLKFFDVDSDYYFRKRGVESSQRYSYKYDPSARESARQYILWRHSDRKNHQSTQQRPSGYWFEFSFFVLGGFGDGILKLRIRFGVLCGSSMVDLLHPICHFNHEFYQK